MLIFCYISTQIYTTSLVANVSLELKINKVKNLEFRQNNKIREYG